MKILSIVLFNSCLIQFEFSSGGRLQKLEDDLKKAGLATEKARDALEKERTRLAEKKAGDNLVDDDSDEKSTLLENVESHAEAA